MRPTIFARTRWNYDSYTDFWRLVELAGFPVVYVDQIDWDLDVIFVTTPINGELPAHHEGSDGRGIKNTRRARLVWWYLERPDAEPPSIAERLDQTLRVVDAAWTSDRLVASLDPRLQHVVLGSDPGLRVHGEEPKVYDYTHQSYAWGRREAIHHRLVARGLREGPASWGAVRERVLASSRLMLNLQQYSLPLCAPLRFAIAAPYSLPIVTEALHDPYPLQRDDLIEAPYDAIVDTVVGALGRPDLLDQLGWRTHQRLCVEWTFRRGVSEGIAASGLA
jgi:hypothetical protein